MQKLSVLQILKKIKCWLMAIGPLNGLKKPTDPFNTGSVLGSVVWMGGYAGTVLFFSTIKRQ